MLGLPDVFRYRLFRRAGLVSVMGALSRLKRAVCRKVSALQKPTTLLGRIVMPGLIDSHMHIESSLLTPRRFAEAVLPFGTTTILSDPHEVGNVAGEDGVNG